MPTTKLGISKRQEKEDNPLIRAKKAYEEAERYLVLAEVALDKEFFVQSLVNVAFSCELFSKSILYYEKECCNITKKGMHSLTDLYSEFSDNIKKSIIVGWKSNEIKFQYVESKKLPEEMKMSEKSLREEINGFGEAFEFWRYNYEYKTHNCNVSAIFDYANLLRKVGNEYHEGVS